jgi:hypothetical protein
VRVRLGHIAGFVAACAGEVALALAHLEGAGGLCVCVWGVCVCVWCVCVSGGCVCVVCVCGVCVCVCVWCVCVCVWGCVCGERVYREVCSVLGVGDVGLKAKVERDWCRSTKCMVYGCMDE